MGDALSLAQRGVVRGARCGVTPVGLERCVLRTRPLAAQPDLRGLGRITHGSALRRFRFGPERHRRAKARALEPGGLWPFGGDRWSGRWTTGTRRDVRKPSGAGEGPENGCYFCLVPSGRTPAPMPPSAWNAISIALAAGPPRSRTGTLGRKRRLGERDAWATAALGRTSERVRRRRLSVDQDAVARPGNIFCVMRFGFTAISRPKFMAFRLVVTRSVVPSFRKIRRI